MNESKPPPTWTQTGNARGKQPTRLTRPHMKQRARDFLLSSLTVHPAASDDDDGGGGGGSGQLLDADVFVFVRYIRGCIMYPVSHLPGRAPRPRQLVGWNVRKHFLTEYGTQQNNVTEPTHRFPVKTTFVFLLLLQLCSTVSVLFSVVLQRLSCCLRFLL